MTVVADLGQGLTGIRSTTPDSLVLDVGILYANVDLAALRAAGSGQLAAAVASAILLGATRGGANWETGRVIRQIPVDGKRYNIKGLARVEKYEPKLKVSLIEITAGNMKRSLVPLTEATYTAFTELSTSLTVTNGSYLTNLCLVTTITGHTDPIIFVLENAMASTNQAFKLEDMNELVMETEFHGYADPATPTTSPARIFYPLPAAS